MFPNVPFRHGSVFRSGSTEARKMFVVAAYIRARVRCRYQKGRCREGSLKRMLRAYVVVALLPLSGPVIGPSWFHPQVAKSKLPKPAVESAPCQTFLSLLSLSRSVFRRVVAEHGTVAHKLPSATQRPRASATTCIWYVPSAPCRRCCYDGSALRRARNITVAAGASSCWCVRVVDSIIKA